MATDTTVTTSAFEASDTTAAKHRITASPQQQEHFTFLRGEPCSAILEVTEDGRIHAHISRLSPAGDKDSQHVVTSSAKECSFNVYASAKCSKDDVFINRAKPVAVSSSRNAFRIGSRIFHNSKTNIADMSEHFDVSDLSFYVDHIEQYGKFLFVTSRQKLLEIPSDENSDSASKKKKEQDKLLKALPGKRENQDNDMSESESEATDSESSIESEALSAYESWSEASTEHSETEILRDTRPQYATIPGDDKQEGKNPTSDDEEGSSASSEASKESDDDDSDAASVEAPNTRYAHVMDDEEEDQSWDMIWGDPDEPGFDGDEYRGAWGGSEGSDGSNHGEVDGDSDGDSESESDKDEVEKEGEKAKDVAAANTSEQAKGIQDPNSTVTASKESETEVKSSEQPDGLAKDNAPGSEEKTKSEETKKQEKEEPPSMLGSAVSQLQVFDLTASPTTRVFRFTRPTMQLVRDSPPVVHPTKSLVVWPLGDNNILFADYKHNTYFVRKFRASRFWSQHVKIECRFSEDGQYLHVASLEMRRKLPVKKKNSKSVEKEKDGKATEGDKDEEKLKAKAEEEKAKSKCDLLVLTYKLSQRKTTRAPPVLVQRTQLPLGEICLAKALPTFTWSLGEVFVAHAVDCDLKVFRISLFKTVSVPGSNKFFGVRVPRAPIKIEATEQRAEMFFLPPEVTKHNGRVIITREQPAVEKVTSHANGKTEGVAEATKAEGDNPEALSASGIKHGPESLEIGDAKSGDDTIKTDELQIQHDADDLHIQVLEIKIGLEADSWKDVDASELDKMVEEGMGQMEVEMVKFDRTDDCDCCDD